MNQIKQTPNDPADKSSQLVRLRLRDMAKLSDRRWVRRYLWESDQGLCPPMAQNGFNEWNYWHLIDSNGCILPTCPELLIRNAWLHRKRKRLTRSNEELSRAETESGRE